MMKAVLVPFLMVILLPAFSCRQSFGPSEPEFPIISAADDSQLSDSLKTVFKENAARLALRYLYETDSCFAEIDIPRNITRSLYNSQVHIYQNSQLPAVDTVFNIFGIQTFPFPVLHEFLIGISVFEPWITNFVNGNYPTGNSIADSLIAKYNLYLKSSHRNEYYVIRTDTRINLKEMSERFSALPGIMYAEPAAYVGDGSDMTVAVLTDSELQISYYFKWGDCPSICIYRHFWRFNIRKNGSVFFAGSGGNSLP